MDNYRRCPLSPNCLSPLMQDLEKELKVLFHRDGPPGFVKELEARLVDKKSWKAEAQEQREELERELRESREREKRSASGLEEAQRRAEQYQTLVHFWQEETARWQDVARVLFVHIITGRHLSDESRRHDGPGTGNRAGNGSTSGEGLEHGMSSDAHQDSQTEATQGTGSDDAESSDGSSGNEGLSHNGVSAAEAGARVHVGQRALEMSLWDSAGSSDVDLQETVRGADLDRAVQSGTCVLQASYMHCSDVSGSTMAIPFRFGSSRCSRGAHEDDNVNSTLPRDTPPSNSVPQRLSPTSEPFLRLRIANLSPPDYRNATSTILIHETGGRGLRGLRPFVDEVHVFGRPVLEDCILPSTTVVGGGAEIRRCVFSGTRGHGLRVEADRDGSVDIPVRVVDSRVQRARGDGIYVEGAQVRMTNTLVSGNGGAGVRVTGRGSLIAHGVSDLEQRLS